MRILFAGTPAFAVPSLKQLHESSSHRVVAVLTNPDAPVGRGRKLKPSPVKQYALEHDIPVLQPSRLGREAREEVLKYEPQGMAVVAYGRIFGPKFLSLFNGNAVNLHPSLLPLYRGPAPLPAAILAGDSVTGISIQKLALKMDSGDILIQEQLPIHINDSAATLGDRASLRGARLLSDALDGLENNSLTPRVQDETAASYCTLLHKDDGIVDWNQSAHAIHRLVRAYTPWPLAHTRWGERGLNILETRLLTQELEEKNNPDLNRRISSLTESAVRKPGTVIGMDKSLGILVQTGDGILVLTRLQLHTKKALDFISFLNGNSGFISSVLGG
ncbi:methionyl-tRNA formyltransferase [Salinispira pacifica]|uniref:Methionyl-tRNA formyltransferase n=1 Tax=Salinispira pacifica TaxID=1307761 RepID=V5WFE0_9SPIO|nr:methionyl-tRNA formyltransferase [Salinispira pacifica]AHC14274.1 Methionyl-tRNA formyltransferase [Salinispira pacifica]